MFQLVVAVISSRDIDKIVSVLTQAASHALQQEVHWRKTQNNLSTIDDKMKELKELQANTVEERRLEIRAKLRPDDDSKKNTESDKTPGPKLSI